MSMRLEQLVQEVKNLKLDIVIERRAHDQTVVNAKAELAKSVEERKRKGEEMLLQTGNLGGSSLFPQVQKHDDDDEGGKQMLALQQQLSWMSEQMQGMQAKIHGLVEAHAKTEPTRSGMARFMIHIH